MVAHSPRSCTTFTRVAYSACLLVYRAIPHPRTHLSHPLSVPLALLCSWTNTYLDVESFYTDASATGSSTLNHDTLGSADSTAVGTKAIAGEQTLSDSTAPTTAAHSSKHAHSHSQLDTTSATKVTDPMPVPSHDLTADNKREEIEEHAPPPLPKDVAPRTSISAARGDTDKPLPRMPHGTTATTTTTSSAVGGAGAAAVHDEEEDDGDIVEGGSGGKKKKLSERIKEKLHISH